MRRRPPPAAAHARPLRKRRANQEAEEAEDSHDHHENGTEDHPGSALQGIGDSELEGARGFAG
jgi:hypothetical protein